MKYEITNKSDIGKNGEGQYILKNTKGKVLKVVSYHGKESKVDESQKGLTDVHALLEPAIKRGLLRHATTFTDEYDDIPSIDYQEALTTVTKADQMFSELPGKMKHRFNNNPKEFLEFVQNPDNAPELQKLGMLKGNDGLTAKGAASGAPTPTDMNANGVPDTITNPDGTMSPNPADSA